MKRDRFVWLPAALCLLGALAAQPGVTRIRGAITGEDGSPLPGVIVTLEAPGFPPRTAVTSADGTYMFSDVPPGTYTIMAQLAGFRSNTVQGFRAVAGQTARLNMMLSSGPVPPPPPTKVQPGDMDAAIRGLPVGQIMYNPPTEMMEGIADRVEVRISQSIEEDLRAGLRGRGVPNVESIAVTSSMSAKLSGRDFEIADLSEPIQRVFASGFTQWDWDVIPKKAGQKKLYLSVAAVFDTEFGEKKKSFPVMERVVAVKVNEELHPTNWGLILTYVGGIVGIAASLFGIFKGLKAARKKRRPRP